MNESADYMLRFLKDITVIKVF